MTVHRLDIKEYPYCKILWILLLSISFSLLADIEEDSRLAQAYYETKAYRQAREIYGKLLEENIPQWKKNEIIYNIATILIAEGEWEEGLRKFNEVLQEPNVSPLLRKRVLTNIAWTHLLQAMSHVDAVDQNSDSSLNEYQKGIFLFREALSNIDKAQKAACDLALKKGEKKCERDPDLVNMQNTAKVQFTVFLQKFRDYQITNLTIRDGLPLLLTTIINAGSRLKFLQNKNITNEIKQHYLQHYLQLEKQHLLYWKILKEKLEKEHQTSPHPEEMELFLEAEKSFRQFIQLFEEENFEQAQRSLKEAEDSLNSLMRLIFGKEPLQVILQKLLASYTLALLQENLQQSTLLGLQNEQKHIERLLISQQTDRLSPINKLFALAEKHLSLGLKALAQSRTIEARLFVEDTHHLIKLMVRLLDTAQDNEPQTILERGINDQEFALLLNRLRQQIEDKGENISSEATVLLIKSQSQVLETVQSFTQEVINYARNEFEHASDPLEQCQDKPWDQVIPLFDQGIQNARQAHEFLSGNDPHWRTAMPLQENVLKYWQEALRLIRQPKKASEKKTEEKEEKPSPAAPESSKEAPAQPSSTELNQTLRLLQEMEQDDQSEPKLDVVPKEEKKPW